MKEIDRSKPVLVTGATGYVAGRLIEKLLAEGLTVHAAVRNPDDSQKLHYLNTLADQSEGSVRYFKSDLLDKGSYADAMEGCELVFHTASPFVTHVEDPQKELINPALLGTRNVLEQAKRTPSVKRVVVTSSCAAIYGDNADLKKTAKGVFTEEDWNTSSSLSHGAYSYSKTLAEREAWKIAGKQDRWDLVTINPSLVIGPGINPQATSESFNIIRQLGDGTMKTGVPDIGFGVVDVRDLAIAHYNAGFIPNAKGRYIISGHNTSFYEMAQALLPEFGDNYLIPRRKLPKFIVWLVGPIINKTLTRKYISRNVGIPWKGDNSKSIKELGMTYRPMQESMVEFFQQAIDSGLLKH
jgi:nucleoside-diphosphate-sugar epimerase